MKKILFREKILDEVYDKSEEYKNNLEKYEANTDDIIEKIEEKIPNRIICLLSNILLNMLLININKRFHNIKYYLRAFKKVSKGHLKDFA